MADFYEALKAYGEKPIVSAGEDGSTAAFAKFAADKYDLNEYTKQVLQDNADRPLIHVLEENIPYKTRTDKFLDAIYTAALPKVQGDLVTNEDFFREAVDDLGTDDAKAMREIMKREDRQFKNFGDLFDYVSLQRQEKVKSVYTEFSDKKVDDPNQSFISKAYDQVVDTFLPNPIDRAKSILSAIDDIRGDLSRSGVVDTGQDALYDLATVGVRDNKINKKLSDIEHLVNNNDIDAITGDPALRKEAIDLLGFGDSGVGQPITDGNLGKALTRVQQNLINSQANSSKNTNDLLKLVLPALEQGVADVTGGEKNPIVSLKSKTAGEFVDNITDNPGDIFRMIASQGQNVGETILATVGGALTGSVASPVGSIAGAMAGAAKAEYNNGFGDAMLSSTVKYFVENKIPVTKENLAKVVNDPVFVKWIDEARDVALVRAGTGAATAGLGGVTNIATSVGGKITLSLAGTGAGVAGGKVEADVKGEKYTSVNAIVDAMFGAVDVAVSAGAVRGGGSSRVHPDDVPPLPQGVPVYKTVDGVELTEPQFREFEKSGAIPSYDNAVQFRHYDEDGNVELTGKPIAYGEFRKYNVIPPDQGVLTRSTTHDVRRSMYDTPEQAKVRDNQRQSMVTEAEYRRVWEEDTGGKGNEAAYRKSFATFTRSLLKKDSTLNEAYADALKTYDSKRTKADVKFVERLRGLSKDVPVINNNTVGRTGLRNSELLDALENNDSQLYKTLSQESPVTTDLLRTAVRNGNTDDIHLYLDKIASESKANGDIVTAIGRQLDEMTTEVGDIKADVAKIKNIDSPETPVEPELTDLVEVPTVASRNDKNRLLRRRQAVQQNKEIVENNQRLEEEFRLSSQEVELRRARNEALYRGERLSDYDGSTTSAREELQLAHGIQLRERFSDPTEIAKMLPDHPTLAGRVIDIVDNANSVGDALDKLTKLNNVNLRREIADIVDERIALENGVVTQTQLMRKRDNPYGSLLHDPVDTTKIVAPVERVGASSDLPLPLRPRPVKQVKGEASELAFPQTEDYYKGLNVARRDGGGNGSQSGGGGTGKPLPPKGKQRASNSADGIPADYLVKERSRLSRMWGKAFTEGRGLRDKNGKLIRISAVTDDATDPARVERKIALKYVNKLAGRKLSKDEELSLNQYLNGIDVDLPEDLMKLGTAMRRHMDDKTGQIVTELEKGFEILRSIGVDATALIERVDALKANLGKYVTRSFDALDEFDTWHKNIVEFKAKAIATLRKSDPDISYQDAQKRVDDIIKDITKHRGDMTRLFSDELSSDDLFFGQTSLNSTGDNIGNLKTRLHLSDWVRELLGERTKGTDNYVNTIYKQTKIFEEIRRDNKIVEGLIEYGMVKKVEATDSDINFVSVTPRMNIFNKYSAMHDVSMHADTVDALVNIKKAREFNDEYAGWVLVNNAFKTAILMFSPMSYVTQGIGAVISTSVHSVNLAANRPQVITGFNDYISAMKGIKGTADADYVINAMARRGITDSASIADFIRKTDAVSQKKPLLPAQVLGFLRRFYSAPDRWVKMANFFTYLAIEKRAVLEDVQTGRISADTDVFKTAVDKATDEVANFFPTTQRSYEGIKAVRAPRELKHLIANIFANPFITFTAEMPRTTIQTIRYIGTNINGENSVRRSAARRMVAGGAFLTASMAGYEWIKEHEYNDQLDPYLAQNLIPKYDRGVETVGGGMDEHGNMVYKVTEYINSNSLATNMLRTTFHPNLTLGEKATRFLEIGKNNFLGGSPVFEMLVKLGAKADGVTGNNIIGVLENNVLKSSETIWGIPMVTWSKKMLELQDRVSTPATEKLIYNQWMKLLRMDDRIITPDKIAKNAGESVKAHYSTYPISKLLRAPNAKFDAAKADELITDIREKKYQGLMDVLPEFVKALDGMRGKIEDDNYDNVINTFTSKSGLSKAEWFRAERLYRLGKELTPESIGIDVMPAILKGTRYNALTKVEKAQVKKNLQTVRYLRAKRR